MPTLNWIGRKAVENHHRQVPFHLLKDVPDLSVGDPGTGNLLVEGDNLLALKALLPYYGGQVKCIYIDPPYNTGNEGWIYNDNVNSPEMRDWLGKVVGKEADDLTRHDKWLCMMYPRLELLRMMLRDDGVIFISIGRDELANLRHVCDLVFGPNNMIEILVWNTHGHTENQEDITGVHEYVLLYAKRKELTRIRNIVAPSVPADSKIRRDFAENSITKNGYKNPPSVVELPALFPCEVDKLDLVPFAQFDAFKVAVDKQKYISRDLTKKFGVVYPVRLDRMTVRSGVLDTPCRVFTGWMAADKLREFIAKGCQPVKEADGSELRFFLSSNGVVYYRREGRQAHYVESVLTDLGTTETNRYLLEGMGIEFTYPKPVELIAYLLSLYCKEGDLVLDSFAGSGTTGHAAMRLTGAMRFILIQMPYENEKQKNEAYNICEKITAKRLKCVITGYTDTKGVTHEGLGNSGFRYCRFGDALFDERGQIRNTVRFPDLARHVYFVETGEPLPRQARANSPLVGVCRGTAIYLLYNGILKDKSPDGGNVLTTPVLAALPKHDGPRVIYGTACRLGPERLRREGIVFKQLPYKLRVDAP